MWQNIRKYRKGHYGLGNPCTPLSARRLTDPIVYLKHLTNFVLAALDSFQILKGRSGEYVIDRDHKKVNLTGLIFGRHHPLFNHTDFIQVKQISEGSIEILFVARERIEDPQKLFDAKNLNFDITFRQIEEPVRTGSGKINLKVD